MVVLSSDSAIAQQDVSDVLEMASEPSYVSEIARKLIAVDPAWAVAEITAIEKVAILVTMIEDRNDVEIINVGYDGIDTGQRESSPKNSLKGDGDSDEHVWEPYTIVHYLNEPEVREEYQPVIDQSITVEEKAEMVKTMSKDGNDVSRNAELILQDVLERQFKHYKQVETPDYNDPGVDFYVKDMDQRDYGLAVEVSVRWVNPIDKPYFEAKKEKAFDKDADLLIIAPKFTNQLLEDYENPDRKDWNADPLSEMIHLHRVPSDEPSVYHPFSKKPDELGDEDSTGNPVIVADDQRVRDRLKRLGHVGNDYPIVDDDYVEHAMAMDSVGRDYNTISEAEYRNQIREALEPLLWEFLRPYMVEHFLIDTYWDKGLTQDEIGELVDRNGGTIGTWMRKWGVMRRGTGAPELSNDTIEIWKRMYEGKDPFQEEMTGYRIQAEYNRHPLWTLDDWEDWYKNTSPDERQETLAKQDNYTDSMGYTLMFGPKDRLQPSYTFILNTLKEEGVEIRPPDEAPRGAYDAYPSKKALEYMLNKDQNTIVDVSEEE